ncbi:MULTISPECIES: MFS transporter [Leuconostoc]|uniref:MFS transporter n=1 Tax=Leuconostoc TaxID=1243 RepID=UPI000B1DE8A1|nr:MULTISPECIES: MFS transporter [Leuconostoc]MDI6614940.1 MFS transporter [Leuconostoc suionicum]
MTNKLNKMTSPWTLVILSVGFIMAVLDTTGVVLAVPTIEAELHIALNDSIWILNSYILALSSLLLVSGNLARKFGAKRLFITGMIFFVLASIGSGISTNIWTMVFFRLFQGAGAAMFMPSAMTILFLSYPEEKIRARMLGIWTTIISVATGTGSLIGGSLVTNFGWNSIFFINVPLGVVAILYIQNLKVEDPHDRLLKINVLDNFVLFGTLASLVIFLVKVSQKSGYNKSGVIFFGVLFMLFSVFLVFLEKNAKKPIIPIDLLKRPQFLISNLFGFVINISLYGLTLVLGLYFQTKLGFSAMIAGLLILPGMGSLIIGNIFYTKKIKNTNIMRLVGVSTIITVVGSALFLLSAVFINPLSQWTIIIIFAFLSFGLGMLTPATTTILMNSAGKEYSSIAGASLNANKQVGGLIGTTLMGIIISSNGSNWYVILIVAFAIQLLLYIVTALVNRFSLN